LSFMLKTSVLGIRPARSGSLNRTPAAYWLALSG
jgi:hypothetical protein